MKTLNYIVNGKQYDCIVKAGKENGYDLYYDGLTGDIYHRKFTMTGETEQKKVGHVIKVKV